MSWVMASQVLVFVPILFSVLIYTLNRPWVNYLVFLAQTTVSVVVSYFWIGCLSSGVISFTLGGWSKLIGIEFRIDNLSLIFMTMAVIIWWIILLYAWHQKKKDYKFLFFLMFLEGSFLALVQVNDFFSLFILIEIITIIASILIIYKKDGISLKAGLYYLLFNSIGMTIYLFGVHLLYIKMGTLNMTLVQEILLNHSIQGVEFSIIQISFACFFVSMCAKTAMFPVYDWLPRAHTAAPSYISALLSGLLVKAGLFGLLRILGVYQIDSIYPIIFYLGFFTAISGILFAISQNDIKGILAFSTISQIGFIFMGLSAHSDVGLTGVYMHMMNHFMFKSLLFLSAGIIINQYNVRRVSEIKGLLWSHPVLSICMMIGLLSITGAPLFVGFLSKTMIKLSLESPLQLSLFRIVSIGSIISYMKFFQIFFGEPPAYKKIQKGQLWSVLLLTMMCLIFFIFELRMMPYILGINGSVSNAVISQLTYIKKAMFDGYYLIEYIGYFIVGYIIYKLILNPQKKIMHFLRHFRVKFQDAIISLLLFLILIIEYL